MSRRRSDEIIDWKSAFMSYFSHDGAVGAQADDGEDLSGYFTTRATRAKAPVGSGPAEDVPAASEGVANDLSPMDEDEQGEDVSRSKLSPKCSGKEKKNDGQEAAVDLGPDDVPAVSKGVDGLSLVDEDEEGRHVSRTNCSKSSPKPSEKKKKKKNDGKLPVNKQKGKGHGGKGKRTSAAKMHSSQPSSRALSVKKPRTIDSEESDSDYEGPLPNRFPKRRKQQVQNSSSGYSRKVQDVILLDDEDVEPKEEVNPKMSDRLDDDEAIELNRSDMKCLDPKAFLSSPVINFYIKYIKRTTLCNENSRDKFYIFNTYFFGKLKNAKYQLCDYAKLRRWWKGVNIFNNAYIILPIHAREHWSLIIICLPPKERISEPIILHLDSLEMHRSNKILSIIEWYLEKEWRFLSVAEPAWPCLLSGIRKEIVQVPQQDNAYDCGIFMLYYIERFIKEAPARFTTDKLGMFNRSWFKPEEASSLRQRIREILVKGFENPRLDDATPEEDEPKGFDNIKDREFKADDISLMIIEVGVGLGNTVESNGGKNVAALKEASAKSEVAIKSTTRGIKVASSQEASKESQIEGMKVVASEEATGESGDALKRTGGINVATSQEASEEFRSAGKSIEGINVAELEEASEESLYAIKVTGGIKVAASQEASEESQNAGKTIEAINVAEPEEASEKSGDAIRGTGGIKIAASQEASEEFQNADSRSIEGINVAESKEASEESGDAIESTEGIKVAASQEASEESQDVGKTIERMEVAESEEEIEESGYVLVRSTGWIKVAVSQEASEKSQNTASKSIEGINVAKVEEASEVPRDYATSIGDISVAKSDKASGLFGYTGKTNKGIKVETSKEASIEFGYADKSMEAISKVVVLNKGTTSSNKLNAKNAGCVLSDSVKAEKGTVNTDYGRSKAEKDEFIVIALPERLEANEEVMCSTPNPDMVCDSGVKKSEGDKVIGRTPILDVLCNSGVKRYEKNEEVIGSTPIPDVVFDSGVKRSEQNEEVNGSMPIPDVVCDGSGVKRSKENKVIIGNMPIPDIVCDNGVRRSEKNKEVISSTLIPDVVCGSGVERSEGNEEASGSMPVPDAVCEITGTKVWIRRVYRRTTLPLGNWSWSSGGSARDARRAFMEQFSRK